MGCEVEGVRGRVRLRREGVYEGARFRACARAYVGEGVRGRV